MKRREYTTIAVLVLTVGLTVYGSWRIHERLSPKAAPSRRDIVDADLVRTSKLELVDADGRLRLFATTNGDEVQLTMQGTEAGSPIVHLVVTSEYASVRVSSQYGSESLVIPGAIRGSRTR